VTVKDYNKYLALSRCFNKTYGAPSTTKSSTETVTVKLVDDEMASCMFLIIVNFSSEGMWRELRKRWLEEGVEKIQKTLDQAVKEYKDITGDTVKFEINKASVSDGLEFVNYNLYNPKKVAYFRVFCNAKIT
jgi:hypothetical protein